MRQADWHRRFFESTRGRVLRLLCESEKTVTDLAGVLELTDNAIRAHLATLERDGLVRQSGKRPGTRKPNLSYDLTPAGRRFFPQAHAPVLIELVGALQQKYGEPDLQAILRTVGLRLTNEYLPGLDSLPPADRVQRLLGALGRTAVVAGIQETADHILVQGCSCPLSDLVQSHPTLCATAAEVLSTRLGRRVTETCDRSGPPKCRFAIFKSA